ncbi:MAG: hypothetical protein MUC49_04270 [Raineya sp.]|jgi:hypothetical protein|nr:hypothetical protein [Raineya sp.]
MKIIAIKKWCDENITPLAWQRIVMKNLDAFKTTGLSVSELSNPTEAMEMNDILADLVKQTIKDVYQIEIPVHAL